MSEKKLFQAKRWTEYYGAETIGYSEVTEEEKKEAEELFKKIRKESKNK